MTPSWNGLWTCSKASLFTPSGPARAKGSLAKRAKKSPSPIDGQLHARGSRQAGRRAKGRPGAQRMTLLALETSCDETSAAVVRDGRVLANVVSSQIALHADYGGVVPELATREHLRNLVPVAQTALREARVTAKQLDAVAATRGPGLPSALKVGLKAAQAMAFALRKSFLGIHHHEAHLYSPWIGGDPPVADFASFQPNVSLIVSGGGTLNFSLRAEMKHRLPCSTCD